MSYWNGAEWVPDQPDPPKRASRGRRLFGATFEATLIVALTFGLIAGTAFAAKGGGNGPGKHGGGSYTVMINESGPYAFGSSVTVTTDAPVLANNAGPWISLACAQNGVTVGTADHAGFEGGWYYGLPFALGPSTSWTGGAADCTFTVFHVSNKRTVIDATMSFHVDG